MAKTELVRHHIRSQVRAAMAESNGFVDEADRLRALGNLRLIVMSTDELWQLAESLAHLPSRPAATVLAELHQGIKDRKQNAKEWIDLVGYRD